MQITPLIGAIITNNVPMVIFLLENNKQCVNTIDPAQNTPLTWSADTQNVIITKLLLSYGANPNTQNNGISPLFISTSNCDEALMQELLDHGADVNAKSNINILSPFFITILIGNTKLISQFLKCGADIYDRLQSDNSTALVFSIKRYFHVINDVRQGAEFLEDTINIDDSIGTLKEIITILLNHDADINAQDALGGTALMYAAILGFTEIAELLINKGANLTLTDTAGKTALDLAQEFNRLEVVEILKNS